jgi:ABC-type Fe3+-hydroxamate transport system substrate-binding protein
LLSLEQQQGFSAVVRRECGGGAYGAGVEVSDDLGLPVTVPAEVSSIVSLVPSLTDAVASCDASRLAGATKYCSHPPGLPAERIGGTKNPDVPRIIALRPDVVLANEEENREPDLAALRAAGVAVWVTRVRDLPEALTSLGRMITIACRLPAPGWLDDAARAWALEPARPRLAIIPIWRRPWMVLGSDTFAGDLLARLGVANVYADHDERYPRIELAELQDSGADLVVLPEEPYRFTADDGPEAFPGLPAALVSGRHLTWYGPSLAEAPAVLSRQLGGVG